MKKITILILCVFPLASFGQTYSGYYGVNANVNQNISADINVNKNVDVSGNINVNKTITNIDYGALRLANAQREKNRLEMQIYANEEQKRMVLEIASNPLKAFDYGVDSNWEMEKEIAEGNGWKKKTIYYHKIPNESLFVSLDKYGYNYINESPNGVITEIELTMPQSIFTTTEYLKANKKDQQQIVNSWYPIIENHEKWVKEIYANAKKELVGKVDEDGNYVHKVDLSKAKIFGQDGFLFTKIYENDFEYVIKDTYSLALPNGVILQNSGTRYRGDKDVISFEDLEGRREYFKRLVNQIFATAALRDPKGRGEIFNN